jgi:hypothetical protein
MADFPGPPSTREADYRPISGFAVAGLIASGIFAGLVCISAVLALVQGAPLFFPAWILLIAVGGALLCVLALREIASSEGTKAGAGIAKIGIWLSLLTGLGYFAYYYVTGLAIASQANVFLLDEGDYKTGFFPHLEKAATNPVELRAAFLLTQPRSSLKPEDATGIALQYDRPSPDGEKQGAFTAFHQHILARAFGKGVAGQVTVTPLGVQTWSYESRSYKVVRNYRVSSPELEMEIQVPVQSTEPEEAGESRHWFVVMTEVHPLRIGLTQLGTSLQRQRAASRAALEAWLQQLNKGESAKEYNAAATNWERVLPSADLRKRVQERVAAVFQSKAPNRLRVELPRGSDGIGDWEKTSDGRLLFTHHFRWALTPNEKSPGAKFEGTIDTTSTRPVDPTQEPAASWDIGNIRFLQAVPQAPMPKRAVEEK